MNPRFPPYPTYEPSGIQWLGDIPAHWEVKRLKNTLSRNDSGVWGDDFDDEGTIVLRSTDMSISGVWNISDPARRSLTADEIRYARLFTGDLVVTKSSGSELHLGKTAIVTPEVEQLNCCFSNFMQRLRARNENEPRFLYWLLNSQIGREQLNYFGSTTTGLANLNGSVIGSLFVGIPPLPEQRAIAAFLDRETARLDALIAKNERLIQLLQEKRAALISRAVTRGLDANAPLKDSGVEWLGWVPERWEVKRIRDVAESIQTGPFGSQLHSNEYSQGGIPVINPAHLDDGKIAPDWNVAVDEQTFQRLSRHELNEGDIVFARRGEMGRCALVTKTEAGWLCGSGSMRVRLRTNQTFPPFLNRVLSTRGAGEWLLLESVGTTMDNLNRKIVGGIPLALPPLAEQRAIAAHLDRETAKIDALIGKVRAAIEKLLEYRAALIAAAVTGKIDVAVGSNPTAIGQ